MTPAFPFVREAGSGPAVVCLHSNASSSSQWRELIERLAPRHHVLAPDLYGAGKSPDWHSERHITLREEAALIEPLLARAHAADGPLVLVGHSHGAAVALIAALVDPARVRAMVLYEPTLFALIDAHAPAPNAADGIRHAVEAATAALDNGQPDEAARCFIDYWMGAGAWQSMPGSRQATIATSVKNIRRWAHALMREPTPAAAFRALDMPVLYLVGERSTASAHGVADLLVPALPRAQRMSLEGLGHMGPVTHAARVNEVMAAFIERATGAVAAGGDEAVIHPRPAGPPGRP
jgi:pimeloyl-ACP methyl ester carboxylesterase